MTPAERSARQRGKSWAISLARAEHAGPASTVAAYVRRRDAERAGLTEEEHAAFRAAYHDAHDAEWARLEEGR